MAQPGEEGGTATSSGASSGTGPAAPAPCRTQPVPDGLLA